MRHTLRCLLALSLGGLCGAAVPARAQEPVDSELEFVRKLRSKGFVDFAKAYLERMAKRSDPQLAALLPLEQARTLLAAAREKDAEQRFGMFNQARTFLKQYVDQNAGKPEAAEGTLELARLSSYEGQALLTKALRELDPGAQQDLAKPAETKFVEGAKELDVAIKMLQGLTEESKVPDDVKKRLKQELTQARFDKGINFIDQARTYVNTAKEDVNLKRAQIIQEAKKVFVTLADEESLSIRSQANAWLMKIAMEEQDPGAVEKYYNRVMGHKEADARPGQRWARLFDMQDVLANGKNPRAAKLKTAADKLALVQKMGLSWLKDYPTALKTPEGEAVLWELAGAYYLEAKEAEKGGKDKKAPKLDAGKLFDQAQKYYGMLAQGEGDYSEKANQVNLSISFQRMGQRKEFRTFDELYLKSQFELLEMQKLAGKRMAALKSGDEKDAEKADKEWKAKLREVTHTLARAISVASDRTPIQKLDEARYYLTSAYLLAGDPYRAAIAGEALGRTRPPTRRAPAGAGYAIDAYANLLGREYSEGTRERLEGLIKYVLTPEAQKFWSSDPVTAIAHYQLAQLYKRDGDARAAVTELEKLPKEFPAYIYAQGQLVFIALKGRADPNTSDKDKAWLGAELRKAVDRMPPLPDDADPSTALMYFLAQAEKSKLMYEDAYTHLEKEPLKAGAAFQAMGKFVDGLLARFEKMPIKLTPKNREAIDLELHVMRKYANLGLAKVEYREGKFDKVEEVTKPAVEAVKKADDGKGGPIRVKDYRVLGDTLGLALRAEVQKGNLKEGKALLDLLKRLTGEGENQAGNERANDVVRNLLAEISQQVKQLQEDKNEKKLKEMVGSFGTFLDTLLKDSDAKKMPPGEIRMLAQAYSGLGRHDRAAELYAQTPAPKVLDSKKAVKDLKEDEIKELGDYWVNQWEQAKELRKAKDYAKALQVVSRWITHPRALYQMPYGAMERNFILEDDGKFGAATFGWNKFMDGLKRQIADNPKMKQYYFEGYFYGTRTLVKYAKYDPQCKNKEKAIEIAAKRILDLEFSKSRDGWDAVGERFQELLRQEPELNAVYQRLKKERAVAAGQ